MNNRNPFDTTDGCIRRYTAPNTSRQRPVEDRIRLYLLSFLLTADREKAEKCSEAGLEMSTEDYAATRNWTHSWARRIVIHNALQLIAPHPETRGHVADSGSSQ